MVRYTIFLNYDTEMPIGYVELNDDVPDFAINNGAILPLLRGNSKDGPFKTTEFGLVLRPSVDINRPLVGNPEKS
jgi:hypothetical protein